MLARELREIGAGDIADERNYLRLDGDDGEARLHDPQKRLVEMLKAFERKLAVEDRDTYDTALTRMNETLRGEGPRGATVELGLDEDRDVRIADLGKAPMLGEVRRETNRLIGQLLESRLPPRSLA